MSRSIEHPQLMFLKRTVENYPSIIIKPTLFVPLCKQSSCIKQTVHLTLSHSLHTEGHWGTTGDVATIPFHLSRSSAALKESSNPIPIHSLMLSSYLFCLPLLLAPFSIPCRIVLVMPEDLEMWPYFFIMGRRSTCTPIASWILLRTYLFVTWSL